MDNSKTIVNSRQSINTIFKENIALLNRRKANFDRIIVLLEILMSKQGQELLKQHYSFDDFSEQLDFAVKHEHESCSFTIVFILGSNWDLPSAKKFIQDSHHLILNTLKESNFEVTIDTTDGRNYRLDIKIR